jgi:hypothetical protein
MLLLVLAAAFVFLFQGRETLREQVDDSQRNNSRLEADLKDTATDLAASEATRQAVEALLTATESDVMSLEGQLLESEQEVDELTGSAELMEDELATAKETIFALSNESEQARLRQPVIEIVAPDDKSVFLPDETVRLVVSAGDANGISAVSVTVDDEPLVSRAVEDKTVHTILEQWTPAVSGSYTISAMAANSNGLTSEAVTITVQVVDLDTQNRDALRQVETDVVQLRGLTLSESVDVSFLDGSEPSRTPVTPQSASSDSPESSAYVLAMSTFDFLEPGYDLADATSQLAESELAVHDPNAITFAYSLEDGELDQQTVSSHAHQLTHALQAQHYQPELARSGSIRSDADDALNAFVEGEAGLVELLLRGNGSSEGQGFAADSANNEQTGELRQSIPAILVSQHQFIHSAGLAFAQALYAAGESNDFALIDAAWEQPPASTEQILHPERYLAGDSPVSVTLPSLASTLGAGWELRYEDSLGELFLREYLLQQLTEEPTITATTGWGGDRVAVYFNEIQQTVAMVLRVVWDTVADSAEFAALYPNYPARLFGVNPEPQPDGSECWLGEDVICLSRSGEETVIARSPDLETTVSIIQLLAAGEDD